MQNTNKDCVSHLTVASCSNPFPFLHLGYSSSPTPDGVRYILDLSFSRAPSWAVHPALPSLPLSAAFSGCLTQLAWIANPASSLAAPRSSVAVRLVHPSSLSNSQDCFSRERTERGRWEEEGGGRRAKVSVAVGKVKDVSPLFYHKDTYT